MSSHVMAPPYVDTCWAPQAFSPSPQHTFPTGLPFLQYKLVSTKSPDSPSRSSLPSSNIQKLGILRHWPGHIILQAPEL